MTRGIYLRNVRLIKCMKINQCNSPLTFHMIISIDVQKNLKKPNTLQTN